MKCPMSNYVMERESGEDEVLLNDCFKEECAWWNETMRECSLVSIARNMNEAANFLGLIKDKMPCGGGMMITVYLEDHWQDFLEWDVEGGEVTGCRPFQGWMWVGTKVHNTDIQPGDILEITLKNGERTSLNYPVERVVEHVSV